MSAFSKHKKLKLGVLGTNISYSKSPQLFRGFFEEYQLQDAEYHLLDLKNIAEVENLLKQRTYHGLNVTIPFKKEVLAFCHSQSAAVQQLNAANTLSLTPHGYKADNTDVIGIESSLDILLKEKNHSIKALVLGNGGSSSAVQYVLQKMEIPFVVVSRNKTKNNLLTYGEISAKLLQQHRLLINTTPLGSHQFPESIPQLPYSAISSKHLAFDLIYSPEETPFLAQVKAKGGSILNGLSMLKTQARASFRIWTGY